LQKDGINDRQQAVRDTWFKDVAAHPNVDIEFFDGARCGCPDDHLHVVYKTMFAYKYAYEKGYQWVFKADDDSFVYVDRLVRYVMELPEDVHYAGLGQCDFGWGGVGYLISRHGLSLMLNETTPDITQEWREDYWTGQILWKHGIRLHETSAQLQKNYDRPSKNPFSVHAVSPSEMRELYIDPNAISKF